MKRFLLCVMLYLAGLWVAHGAELVIDYEHSTVIVTVKATGHDFDGALTKYQVVAIVDESLRPTSGRLTWDFQHLKTGNGDRDKKMISWLSPKLTKASFVFEKWLTDKTGKTSVQGIMEIHGVKQRMVFPVELKKNGTVIVAKGSTEVDHTNFKLPVITFLKFFKVNPKIKVSFDVKGTLN